ARRLLRQRVGAALPRLAGGRAREQRELGLVRAAGDHLEIAVAVDVRGLDRAREAGEGELRRGLGARRGARPRAEVAPDPRRLGRAGRGVVAAVRDQEVDSTVAVEVRDLDLVAPLR